MSQDQHFSVCYHLNEFFSALISLLTRDDEGGARTRDRIRGALPIVVLHLFIFHALLGHLELIIRPFLPHCGQLTRLWLHRRPGEAGNIIGAAPWPRRMLRNLNRSRLSEIPIECLIRNVALHATDKVRLRDARSITHHPGRTHHCLITHSDLLEVVGLVGKAGAYL